MEGNKEGKEEMKNEARKRKGVFMGRGLGF